MTRSVLVLVVFLGLVCLPSRESNAQKPAKQKPAKQKVAKKKAAKKKAPKKRKTTGAQKKAKAAAIKIAAAAKRDYLVGKFAEALVTYRKAYEVYPAPGLLFNIGQCHSKLKQWSMAIFSYQAYLRERPNTRNRPVVEELLRDARAALDKQQKDNAAAKERREAERRKLEAEERQRREDERQAKQRKLLAQPPGTGTRNASPFYKKWWFWTTVGVVATSSTIIFATSGTNTVLPERSLGILDRR